MEAYGKILLIAIPIFTLLVLLEKIYGYLKGEDTSPAMDSIASLSSGLANITKDVLGLSVTLLSYTWMVKHMALFTLSSSILNYVIAFVVIDFHGYWGHRWAHQINFFWNKHAIHHSSEEFNLACALRQSVSSFVNLFTFLLLPAALVGVPADVILITLPLHLFAQFWYHTRHIGKLGILEKIIVTPSHHRVHHAINPEYMDKNHGQIFIFWDKLFGTFQEELPHVPPVYGITRPAATWNPIKINFQHLILLIKDAWRARDWKDKLRIWFMPTGWRPSDVAHAYPVHKIEDVYHFQKFGQDNPPLLVAWSGIQMTLTALLAMFLFGHFSKIGSPHIFIYGAFLLLTIYSFTELMDKNPYSLIWEFLRAAFGMGCIAYYGDWFGLNAYLSWGNYGMIAYFVFSGLVNLYFVILGFKPYTYPSSGIHS